MRAGARTTCCSALYRPRNALSRSVSACELCPTARRAARLVQCRQWPGSQNSRWGHPEIPQDSPRILHLRPSATCHSLHSIGVRWKYQTQVTPAEVVQYHTAGIMLFACWQQCNSGNHAASKYCWEEQNRCAQQRLTASCSAKILPKVSLFMDSAVLLRCGRSEVRLFEMNGRVRQRQGPHLATDGLSDIPTCTTLTS